jgi:hypothetical protein
VEISSHPRAWSPRARSSRPDLSETERRARGIERVGVVEDAVRCERDAV